MRFYPAPFATAAVSLFGMTAAVFACILPATAQVTVYNNGDPNFLGLSISDQSNSGTFISQFMADTFTFTSTTSFNQVQWFGGYIPNNTPILNGDNFTISFYNTTNGVPNASPIAGLVFNVGNVGRVDTGSVQPGLSGQPGTNVYRYVTTLPSNLSFNPGTYAIGIVNITTSDTSDDWGWGDGGVGTLNGVYARTSQSGNYSAAAGNLSFQLQQSTATPGIAPEPGSLALLLPVMGVAVMVIRKRRSK